MNKSFCIFIISHGRPDKVITIDTLRECGYDGPYFIICDNEDSTIDEYRKTHGEDKIIIFDKMAYASMVDSCDNFNDRRTTTHARNACFDIARELGYEYFLVLDDDYTEFRYTFDPEGNYIGHDDLNDISRPINACLDYLESCERISTICFMQGGEMFGGGHCTNLTGHIFPFKKRKAMNSFFCKTNRRFWFFSRLNEDVNTYLALGKTGGIFLTIPDIFLVQKQTQANPGGMSDTYLESGTYVKSFYSVMINPSFAKVKHTQSIRRLHHWITWNHAIPKIINPENRK